MSDAASGAAPQDTIGRRLGIDWGKKRIGVAVSDGLGLSTRGLVCLEGLEAGAAAAKIAALAAEHEAVEVIVGLPKNMNDSLGPQAARAKTFADVLRKRLDGIPVILWDERLSTVEAERHMAELGYTRKRKHEHKDRIAAAVILQSYLDARRAPREALSAEKDEEE